jgi:hypothetical protein
MGVMGSIYQGTCRVCREEDGSTYVLRRKGSSSWGEELVDKESQVLTQKFELEGEFQLKMKTTGRKLWCI